MAGAINDIPYDRNDQERCRNNIRARLSQEKIKLLQIILPLKRAGFHRKSNGWCNDIPYDRNDQERCRNNIRTSTGKNA